MTSTHSDKKNDLFEIGHQTKIIQWKSLITPQFFLNIHSFNKCILLHQIFIKPFYDVLDSVGDTRYKKTRSHCHRLSHSAMPSPLK